MIDVRVLKGANSIYHRVTESQSHRGNHKNSAKFFCSSLWLCVAVVNLFLCAEFTLS